MKTKSMIAISLALALAACGGADPTEAAASSALGQALEGTYDFVLEDSDVAAKVRARCNGDAACWSEVQRDASTEKIRFTTTASGQLVWTSFARTGGKEEVFVEVPVALAQEEPNLILAKSAGWPRGTLVGQITHLRASMRIERRPDGTLAIVDPDKGRLVYRRASSDQPSG